jgi:ribosome-associated protein
MGTIEFQLDPGRDYIELNQLLKLCGLAGSGGEGKHLVASGVVAVDGQVELRRTCKIRAGQRVQVGDQAIVVLAPVAGG